MTPYTIWKCDIAALTLVGFVTLSSQPSYAGNEEPQKTKVSQGSSLQKRTSEENLKDYFKSVESIPLPKLFTLPSLISVAYALASDKDAPPDQITKAILLAQFYSAKALPSQLQRVLDFAEALVDNENASPEQIEQILILTNFCIQKIESNYNTNVSLVLYFVERILNKKNATPEIIDELPVIVQSTVKKLSPNEMWRVTNFAKVMVSRDTTSQRIGKALALVQSCVPKINTNSILDICLFFDFVKILLNNKSVTSKNIEDLLALVRSVAMWLPKNEMWRVAAFAKEIACREEDSLEHIQNSIKLLKLCREQGYENHDHLKSIAEMLVSRPNTTQEEATTAIEIARYCQTKGDKNVLSSLIGKAEHRAMTDVARRKEIREAAQLLINLARHGEETAYKRIISHLRDDHSKNALRDYFESHYPRLKPHVWLQNALQNDSNIFGSRLNLPFVTYEPVKDISPEAISERFEQARKHMVKLAEALSVSYNSENQNFQAAVMLSQRMLQIRLAMRRALKNDFCFIEISPEVYRFLHPKGDKHSYSALIGNCFETYAIESFIEGEKKPQVNYYATLMPENVLQCRKLLSFFQEDAPNDLNKKEKRKFNQNTEVAFDAFADAIRAMGEVKRYIFSKNKTYKEKGKEFLLSCSKPVQASKYTDLGDDWVVF